MLTPDRHKAALGIRNGTFALALVLALGSGAAARSLGSPALVTSRPNRLEPYRFFGNRTVAVPLLVHAPDSQGLALYARLVQLTSNLATPIGAALEVPLPTDASSGPGVEIKLAVPLPPVKRETDFELRFQSRRDRDGPWYAAGQIPFRVYPSDLLSPIRSWAKSHPLRVKDDHGLLIAFLRQQGIPVVVGSQGFRDGRGVTLYAGARALRKRARVPLGEDEAIVLFTERQTGTPHFLIERTDGGTAVSVEMRLLNRLATDPLAHKTFLEVFEILNEEKQSKGGNDR